MDFKQLRSFVTVADCGSFTQAAVRLYTSQPTVSAHIRQLEDELHETLFLRTTKSLAITARGQELYDYAVHVLELQDQLLDAWAQDEHTIRLGASTIPSAYILPEVLPPFRAQHPDAVFSVLQSDSAGVLQQLRTGRFELGFAGAQEQSPELVFLPFFRDRMVLITPNTPHFAKLLQDGTPVRSLLEREPLLLREAGSGSQKCADAFLEEEGLSQRTLHVAARLEDQQSIKNLVAAGLGVSIISGKAAQDDCASGRLLAFPSRFRQTARGGAYISSGAKTARCGSRHWGSSNLSEIFIQSSRTETESKARRIFLRAFDLCLGGDYAAIAPIRASSCALLQALSGWKLLPETAPICFAQSAGCA